MNTAVINIKTDPQVKAKAQKVAQDLGISLSTVVNGALRQFIKTRTVTFADTELELTPWAKRMLKQSEKDAKRGFVSPTFKTAEESIKWLNDPNAKYQNGRPVR